MLIDVTGMGAPNAFDRSHAGPVAESPEEPVSVRFESAAAFVSTAPVSAPVGPRRRRVIAHASADRDQRHRIRRRYQRKAERMPHPTSVLQTSVRRHCATSESIRFASMGASAALFAMRRDSAGASMADARRPFQTCKSAGKTSIAAASVVISPLIAR